MLTNATMSTVLPVSDVDRAAAFYRDRLGLQDLGDVPGGNHALRTTAGATIELMEAEPGAQSHHTAATFGVSDLPQEVAELESRGVAFEDYDLPELKTVGHIATHGDDRAAWFTDTEGNILCLHEAPR
ncbi:VOC family protein [Jiangella endophytica]|uniref:VOC family protein n=1 Tax=Jiangella endophytica TaxID=1623398 RepID=UPI000E350480|nr:VOC family protein [Jiangella endophytica]